MTSYTPAVTSDSDPAAGCVAPTEGFDMTDKGQKHRFAPPNIECQNRHCGDCRYLGFFHEHGVGQGYYRCKVWHMPLMVDDAAPARDGLEYLKVARCQECHNHELAVKRGVGRAKNTVRLGSDWS